MGKADYLLYLPIVVLGISFFIAGFIINLVQLLLWLIIRPISVWLYRKLNYYCLYSLWIQIVFLADWWSSSSCTIYTDEETWKLMGKEHAIVVMNHSYEVDWLMGWLVCEQCRLLASSKVFIKKAIEWVPIIGWAWKFAEVVFLERNWEKDRLTMEQQIENLSEYPDPVWLLLFAEGTRFTPAKHATSMEFARKAGLPPLQHLLIPRTKGFLVTVKKLKGKFPAIYSATICFNLKEGAKPSLKNILLGRRVIAEMVIERVPLSQIPDDPDEAAIWLHKSYQQKDHLIDTYLKEGSFLPAVNGLNFSGAVRCHYNPRRIWSLLNIAFWSYITLPTVFKALYLLLCSGLTNILIAILIIALSMGGLYKLVDLTRVSKGSTYGRSQMKKSD